MPDLKISQLADYSTPIGTDDIPIVDVTTGTTKAITVANLLGTYNMLTNHVTATQSFTAATLTQINGSSFAVPTGRPLRIGTMFRWRFDWTKSGAGVATSAFAVRIGTNNTTADAAILSFTKPAGTAAADTGIIDINCVIRGPLSASCIAAGNFTMTHNLQATGHLQLAGVCFSVVSGAFNATTAGLFVSLSATTGASDVCTMPTMIAQAINL